MRRPALALTVLLAVAALAGCGQSTSGPTPANSPHKAPAITIAMVTHGQAFDPFWALVQAGARQAAADFNVTLKYASPATTNPQQQAQLITRAAAAKPQALVVTIPDPAVLSSPIQQVSSSGVPVVVVNVGDGVYKQVGALTYVGQPDRIAGGEAGKQLVAAGVRDALCVITEGQNTALTDRCAGLAATLAASGGSVQTLNVNGNNPGSAQSAIQQALKRNPRIDGVLSTTLIGFDVSGGALKAMNELGKIKLATFDVSSAALAAVENGQALFIVDQQPFMEGYYAVQVAAFQVRYGQHPFAPIYTGPSFITQANAAKAAQLYKNTGVALFRGGYT